MRLLGRKGLPALPRSYDSFILLGTLALLGCSPADEKRASGLGGASAGGSVGSGGRISEGGAIATGGLSGGPSGGVAQGSGGVTPGGGGSTALGGSTSGGTSSGGASFGGSVSGGANSGGASGANQAGGSNGGSSGSGGRGGTAGVAGSSAGAGAGAGGQANGCGAQSGLLFCEDFEKGTADAAPSGAMWNTSYIGPDMPRIVVDATSPAHRGTRSVSITAPLTNFQSFLNYHDASVLPRPSGEFYLRVWVRLNRPMADHHNAYLVMDRAAAPGAGAAVRLGEQANMLSLTVGGDSHGTLSNANFSNDQVLGAHFTSQTWACLEGYFNSQTPTIGFWLDRTEIKDFRHTDWPADAYDTLHFGFEKYAGPELTIWLDDLAIGSSRIGCD